VPAENAMRMQGLAA